MTTNKIYSFILNLKLYIYCIVYCLLMMVEKNVFTEKCFGLYNDHKYFLKAKGFSTKKSTENLHFIQIFL